MTVLAEVIVNLNTLEIFIHLSDYHSRRYPKLANFMLQFPCRVATKLLFSVLCVGNYLI